jgi:hypothetical protein
LQGSCQKKGHPIVHLGYNIYWSCFITEFFIPGPKKYELFREYQMIPGLHEKITDEIIAAFGFSKKGWARRMLAPLFWLPANHFAQLVSDIDAVAAESGLPAATKVMLSKFIDNIQVAGSDRLPLTGPLLIASNHPGAYDILALLSNIPRRDIKVVVSDVPLIQSLPSIDRHMIYTPAGIGPRMSAVRKLIRHLQEGGVGLIFPSGKVDPDPQISEEGENRLKDWSASLDLILRKIPETQLSVSIVSGVIAPGFLKNPLIRVIGEPWRQQKLAEFLQIIQQLVLNSKFGLKPKITFGDPNDGCALMQKYAKHDLRLAILDEAQIVYRLHIQRPAVQ